MKHIVMILGMVLMGAGFAVAEEDAPDYLTIKNAYAYATTSVQKNGAVFMSIHRQDHFEDGEPADYDPPRSALTKAESDVAERVELHTHIMEDDIMMMREVEEYTLENNATLTLKPTGHHIMLFGLKAPLEVGTEFPMTLYFDNDNRRDIMVKIIKPGETP